MPGYKLLYFNVRGKGEMMRYVFSDLGLDFEDEFYDKNTWPAIKSQMEFGQLPCLRHGDFQIVQSSAIMRYLARKHDLYGDGDVEATMIDMIHDGSEDLRSKYLMMIYRNYEAGKKPFIDELPASLNLFEVLLKKNDGGKGGFVGAKTCFADYSMFDLMDDMLVLAPTCLDAFPALKAFHGRMAERPGIAKFRMTPAHKERDINGNGKQ